MKKNKLTNMELDSVDLCKQGANQMALLTLPQTDSLEPLGRYARICLTYLKTQRPVLYNQMFLNGSLWPHLQEVQKTASEQAECTIAALADKFPAPEKSAHSSSGRPI